MGCKSKKYLHIYDWNYWWGYPVKELCIPGQFKAVGGCAMRHELFHGLLAVGRLLCPVRLSNLAPHRPDNIGKPPGGQL